jgi:hypothetical protein
MLRHQTVHIGLIHTFKMAAVFSINDRNVGIGEKILHQFPLFLG